MDSAALNNLTPEQVNAVKAQAQQQANITVTQSLMKAMAELCFHKCAGSSVRRLRFGMNITNWRCHLQCMCFYHRATDWTVENKLVWPRAKTPTLSFERKSQRHWKKGKTPCEAKLYSHHCRYPAKLQFTYFDYGQLDWMDWMFKYILWHDQW